MADAPGTPRFAVLDTPRDLTAALMVAGSRKVPADRGPFARTCLRAALQLVGYAEADARATVLLHGGDEGFDQVASRAGAEMAFVVEELSGDAAVGRALALEKRLMVAVPFGTRAGGESPGTWDAVGRAVDAGIPVLVVHEGRLWPANDHAHRLTYGLQRMLPSAAGMTGPKGQVPLAWLSDELLPF